MQGAAFRSLTSKRPYDRTAQAIVECTRHYGRSPNILGADLVFASRPIARPTMAVGLSAETCYPPLTIRFRSQ